MEFKTLKIQSQAQVMNCWLNRPEKRNALNSEMLRELISLLKHVEGDRETRVFVLRGTGKVFSAGADLSAMSEVAGKSRTELEHESGLFFDCFEYLYRLPVPTICFVHGGVHGGANGLVAACDVAVSEESTVFSFREVVLGLVPATVAPFVVRRTGARNARKMMLWGQPFGASEALQAGLVDQVCGTNDAEAQIDKLCRQILGNAPDAVTETKRLLIEIENNSLIPDDGKAFTGLIARVRQSDEAREGIRAFFERREPAWRKIAPSEERQKPAPDGGQ